METSDDERDWGENGCVEWVSISCGRGTWEQMEVKQIQPDKSSSVTTRKRSSKKERKTSRSKREVEEGNDLDISCCEQAKFKVCESVDQQSKSVGSVHSSHRKKKVKRQDDNHEPSPGRKTVEQKGKHSKHEEKRRHKERTEQRWRDERRRKEKLPVNDLFCGQKNRADSQSRRHSKRGSLDDDEGERHSKHHKHRPRLRHTKRKEISTNDKYEWKGNQNKNVNEKEISGFVIRENRDINCNLEENQCDSTKTCAVKYDGKEVLKGKDDDVLQAEIAKSANSFQNISKSNYSMQSEAFKQSPLCNNEPVQTGCDKIIQIDEIRKTCSAGTQTVFKSEWSTDVSIQTDQTDWLRDRSVQASPVVYSRHTQTRLDDPSATVGAPVTSRNAGVQVINDYWSNQQETQTMPQAGCSVPCQRQAASVDMYTEDSSSKTSNDADDGTVPPHSQIAEPQMLTSAEQPSVGKNEEARTLCYYESRADATLSQQSILTVVEIPVNSQSEGNIDPDEETSELNQPKVVQIPPPPPAGRNVYDIDLPGLLEAYRILYNHYAAFQTESISSSCSTRTALLAGHAAIISTDTEEAIPTSKPPSISVAEMFYIRGTGEAVDMAKSESTERCDGNDAATGSGGGLDFSVTSRKYELVNKESDCTMMRDYGVSEDHVDLSKMSVSDALHGEKGAAIISKDKPLDNGSGKLRLQDGEESPGISPLDAAEVLFAMSKKSNNKDPNDKKEGDCGSRNVTFRGCCQAEHPDVGDKDGNCLDLSTEIETEPYIENKMVVDEKLRSDDIGNSRLNRNRSTETAWWSNYKCAALNQASQHSHYQNKQSGNQDTTICKAPVSAMRIASQEDVFGTVCSATPSLSPVTLVQEKQMCLQADGHETPSHVSVCEQKVSEVYHGAPAEKEYDESFTVTTRQQWKNFVSARQVQARTKKESVEVDNTKPCDSFEKEKEEEEVEPLESMKKDGLKTVSYQSERNIQHSNHQETRSISEKKAQTSKVGPGVRSPYTCQICKKKFKSYARFFYHLRHSVKCTKAGKQRLGQTKYVCRMCEGQYATNKGYEKHSCFKQRMLRPRIRRVSYNEDSYTESDVNTSTSQDNQCADSEDVKFETKFPLIEAGAISEESQSHEESCENKAQGSQCKDNLIELKAESTRKGQSSDSYLKTEIVSTIVNMFVDDTQPGCSDTTGDIDDIQLGCCETLGMHLDVPGCVQDPNHNSEGLTTGTSERSLETCGAAQAVQEYSDEVFRRELRVLAGGLVDSWLGGNCDGNSHQSSLGGPVYESVSSIGMDHNYSAQVTTVMPTQAVPPTVALDMFTAAITVPKE